MSFKNFMLGAFIFAEISVINYFTLCVWVCSLLGDNYFLKNVAYGMKTKQILKNQGRYEKSNTVTEFPAAQCV
jgi:hypothetical protein